MDRDRSRMLLKRIGKLRVFQCLLLCRLILVEECRRKGGRVYTPRPPLQQHNRGSTFAVLESGNQGVLFELHFRIVAVN